MRTASIAARCRCSTGSAPSYRDGAALGAGWTRPRQRSWRDDVVQAHVVRELAVMIGQIQRVAEHHVRARDGARVPAEGDGNGLRELGVVELSDRLIAERE